MQEVLWEPKITISDLVDITLDFITNPKQRHHKERVLESSEASGISRIGCALAFGS